MSTGFSVSECKFDKGRSEEGSDKEEDTRIEPLTIVDESTVWSSGTGRDLVST